MKALFISAIIILGVLLAIGFDEASASSLTSSLALVSVPSGAVVQVKQGCKFIDGERICGNKKGNADNDNNNHGAKNNKNTETGSEGERSCGPGFVVLKEENKYGNFCQPTEAVKPNCAPGTVLNGEQCHCPAGTVPKNGINNVQSVSECIKRGKDCLNIPESQAEAYRKSCFTLHNATASCSAATGDAVNCCCEYDSP